MRVVAGYEAAVPASTTNCDRQDLDLRVASKWRYPMSKIISLITATALTVAAAGLWLKSGVSVTVADSRSTAVKTLSMMDLHLAADVKSMSPQKMNDQTFVFA